MKKNIFEMGASWDNGWSSDNKTKESKTTNEIKPRDKHQLHFAKEKRNGKTITIVKPFFLSREDMEQTLKTIKKSLATGGTIKENSLEFQGEVSEKLKAELIKLGFNLKK
ncbi:MAG: translation initiation factor [Sulfurovaceae bacterium]|nr:translation initiation factor [Sulfurovaceae bacterium]MDD5548929.1 translation initiation factor [Sulfurovaceae bacterium]